MKKEQTLLDLTQEAAYMLRDRHPKERDLIYHIAAMDDEEKAAIIIAYEHILPEWENEDG